MNRLNYKKLFLLFLDKMNCSQLEEDINKGNAKEMKSVFILECVNRLGISLE